MAMPFGLGHQRHVLGLQIGGESGVFLGGHIHRAQPPGAANAQGGGVRLCHLRPRLLQLGHERADVFGHAAGNRHVAAGDGAGDQERAGLDAVRNDGVLGAVQPLHALDADGGRARAFDLRAHLDQQAARSATSGSRAALRSTVSPLARTAAIIRSSVPVTVMRSKWTSAPRRPSGASASM